MALCHGELRLLDFYQLLHLYFIWSAFNLIIGMQIKVCRWFSIEWLLNFSLNLKISVYSYFQQRSKFEFNLGWKKINDSYKEGDMIIVFGPNIGAHQKTFQGRSLFGLQGTSRSSPSAKNCRWGSSLAEGVFSEVMAA